jgi:hypothetical protein
VKNFFVSVVARNKIMDVVVRITIVYGYPYEEKRNDFISETHGLFLNWDRPATIGGDFNLGRSHIDKNNRCWRFEMGRQVSCIY